MSGWRGPAWLGEFQAGFGAMLCAPLDRATGTLRATTEAYAPALCEQITAAPWGTAAERLAVYNRQYWFRLLTVMQAALPLTAALMSPWVFNDFAARFLQQRPPAGWDIDRVADGFGAFFSAQLAHLAPAPCPGAQPLLEAVQIDEAWYALFRAPPAPHFRPAPADAARLLTGRLRPSPAAAVLTERWPLLDLRASLRPGDPPPLPPPLAAPRSWALLRRPGGVAWVALEDGEAALLRLLRERSLVEALGQLEALCPAEERTTLPRSAQRWLARSVELGLWSGLLD